MSTLSPALAAVLEATAAPTADGGSGVSVRDVVTAYAALVATAALGWQVWTWRQQRRPVKVRVALACVGYPDGPVWTVAVEAINRSDHAVNVRSAGLMMQDGTGREWVIVRPLDISKLPGAVEPHDAAGVFVTADSVREHFDLLRPVVGWVRLASGDVVRSERVKLMSGDADLST